LVSAAVLPVATIWAIVHPDEVGDRAVALARRLHLVKPERPVTYHRPVERLAADLRRLSTAMAGIRPGTPYLRRVALLGAYEDTLIEASRALGVAESLAGLPRGGLDRELERMRVEAALEAAGLRFRPGVG
jgi:hypothetical protein